MAYWYLKSGQASEFVQSNAYSSGQKMVPKRSDAGSNYLVARRWVWECTTGGTSAGAEPTWPASVTQDVTTVTSGTAVFTARRPGFSSGSTASWAFSTPYLDYINNYATGDIIYISNNHAESVAAAYAQPNSPGGASFVCVDDSAEPPTTLATGASITTTGASSLLVGYATSTITTYFYGVTFQCGSGANNVNLTTNGVFENCKFRLVTTGTNANITPNGAFVYKNCWWRFSSASQKISLQRAPGIIYGGGLEAGGTSPTDMFVAGGQNGSVVVDGCDLSAAASTVNLSTGAGVVAADCVLRNIKMPSGWSGVHFSGAPAEQDAFSYLRALNISAGAGSETDYTRKPLYGSIVDETTIVKSGEDFSWKVVMGANGAYPYAFVELRDIHIRNAQVGSPVTVTMDLMHDSSTNLTDKEVALDVSYPSDASYALNALSTSDPGFMATASDLAASTSAWITTGLSNPNAQKVSATFTPQRAGYFSCRLRVFKASKTLYVSMKPTVS